MSTTFAILTLILLVLLSSSQPSFSADPPGLSPAPAPDLGADSAPSPATSHSSSVPTPSPSPSLNSPPAPPPSDLAPESSPSPAPAPGTNATEPKKEKSPSPAPAAVASDVSHEDSGGIEADHDSSDGMNGGKKAGIAVGVIAGVCIVGIGALVYTKRQQNIRRAQFGYDARREIL